MKRAAQIRKSYVSECFYVHAYVSYISYDDMQVSCT